MAMSYIQKRDFLAYLAYSRNWKTRDITPFLLDPERKKSVSLEEIRNEKTPDKKLWSKNTSVVTFHYKDWPENERRELMNNIKLIVAFDLNLEPGMDARNQWQRDPDQKGFKLTEKPWRDTTEFEGFFTGQTSRFAIETIKGGFLLTTTLEYKERIINQAKLATEITNRREVPIIAPVRHAHGAILDRLAQGGTDLTRYDGKWQYARLKTPDPAGLREKALHLFGDLADLPPGKFTVLTLGIDEVLVAANCEALASAMKARKATMAFMKVADEGLPAGEEPAAFLTRMQKDGADARYIDTEGLSPAFAKAVAGSRNGVSLADMLAAILAVREEYEILAKMKEDGLLNEFTHNRPEPPEPPKPSGPAP